MANKELKQSTQVVVPIGPAVSISDGYTQLTTLDISTADYAYLIKSDGTLVDISGRTWAALSDTNTSPNTAITGYYNLTLTTSDLNTLGRVKVMIYDVSLTLPIWEDFSVIDANEFDSKYTTSSPTTYKNVNVVSLSAGAIDSILDEPITEPSGTFSWAGATLRNIVGWLGALARNPIEQTSTTQTLKTDTGSPETNISTATVSDDGTTTRRGPWS